MLKLKYLMLFILLVTRTVISVAQQKGTAATCQFHSINSIGLMEGSAGSAFQLQTINGAQYKSGLAELALDWTTTGTGPYRFLSICGRSLEKTLINYLFILIWVSISDG